MRNFTFKRLCIIDWKSWAIGMVVRVSTWWIGVIINFGPIHITIGWWKKDDDGS